MRKDLLTEQNAFNFLYPSANSVLFDIIVATDIRKELHKKFRDQYVENDSIFVETTSEGKQLFVLDYERIQILKKNQFQKRIDDTKPLTVIMELNKIARALLFNLGITPSVRRDFIIGLLVILDFNRSIEDDEIYEELAQDFWVIIVLMMEMLPTEKSI